MDGLSGINTEQLQAFLDLLVESGVAEFEGYGLHVRFADTVFSPEQRVDPVAAVAAEMEKRMEPRTMWEAPELWPGGKPPTFPGAK